MTDAPPLNGSDCTDTLKWLVAQVGELREENGRMKTLLALHGVTPIEECTELHMLAAEVSHLQQSVSVIRNVASMALDAATK